VVWIRLLARCKASSGLWENTPISRMASRTRSSTRFSSFAGDSDSEDEPPIPSGISIPRSSVSRRSFGSFIGTSVPAHAINQLSGLPPALRRPSGFPKTASYISGDKFGEDWIRLCEIIDPDSAVDDARGLNDDALLSGPVNEILLNDAAASSAADPYEEEEELEIDPAIPYIQVLPQLEGFMQQEGRLRSSWHRKWFVLRNGEMHSYATPDLDGVMKKIPVSSSLVKSSVDRREERAAIECITDERRFVFLPEPSSAARDWFTALDGTISAMAYVRQCLAVEERPDTRVVHACVAACGVRGLSSLRLDDAPLTMPALSAVLAAIGRNPTVLHRLSLAGVSCTPAQLTLTGTSLTLCTALTSLSLAGNPNIGDESAWESLWQLLSASCPALVYLNVSGAQPLQVGAFWLGLVHVTSMRKSRCSPTAGVFLPMDLRINGVPLPLADTGVLSKIMQHAFSLSLCNCGIEDTHAQELSNILLQNSQAGSDEPSTTSTTTVDVDVGAGAGVDVDAGASCGSSGESGGVEDGMLPLKTLLLADNKIGNEGAEALAGLLSGSQWNNLRDLSLSSNNVGNRGAIALAQSISHRTVPLSSLHIGNNAFAEDGLTALASLANSMRATRIIFQQQPV
jgi:hypothetical protein